MGDVVDRLVIALAQLLMPVLFLAVLLLWFRDPTLPRLMLLLGGVFALVILLRCWLSLRWRARLRGSGIAQVDTMDGVVFEHKVGQVLADLGYRVRVTRAQGDFGADVVAERAGERVVVQAKRYGPRHRVGIAAVQEAVAAVAFYRAGRAIVVTNRHFTAPARRLAAANRVDLWDREKLMDVLIRQQASRSTMSTPHPTALPAGRTTTPIRSGDRGAGSVTRLGSRESRRL